MSFFRAVHRAAGKAAASPWVRIGVSAGLLAAIASQLEWGQALAVIATARPELLALMFALALAERLLAAYRWSVLVRGLEPAVGFRCVARVTFVSSFLGYFSPGGVGTEVVRIYGLAGAVPLVTATASILVERVLAIAALILLVAAGSAIAPAAVSPALPAVAGAVLAAMLAAGAGLAWRRPRELALRGLRTGGFGFLRQALARLFACFDRYAALPRLLVWSLAVAVAFQFVRVAEAGAGAYALGADVHAVDLVVIVSVVIFLALLPISIGGLGVQEVSLAYLLGAHGVSLEAAVALSLLMHVCNVLSTLPGALLYAAGGNWRARAEATGKAAAVPQQPPTRSEVL